MAGVIAVLVSLGCVLVCLGLVVRAAFGNATILKLGGLVILVAFLPAMAVGLFNQMSAATPGGASGLGLAVGLAVLSLVAYVGFKVWLAGFAGHGKKGGAKVEVKRVMRFDDED